MAAAPEIQSFVDQALALAREGFGGVNGPLGLIIAVVAAFIAQTYRSVFFCAIGATVVHIIVKRLIPVVSSGAALKLPPLLSTGFWRDAGVLLIGYLIVILFFYVIRRALLKGGH